jgi:toxin ParE1/3/4
MKRRIIKKPQAEQDLLNHFIYMGRDNETAGVRFLEEAEAAFAKIAEAPNAAPVWESDEPRLENICHKSVYRRFRNYLIFYRFRGDIIKVLTIIHGARDLPNILPELT